MVNWPSPFSRGQQDSQRGFTLVALMITISVLVIMLGVAAERWSSIMRREREEELIFRGRQIAQSIRLYQQKHRGTYPPDLKTLFDQKFLRKLYKDPMTESGRWNLVVLSPGSGRNTVLIPDSDHRLGGQAAQIVGVASQSKDKSARIYNDQTSYDKWMFTVFDERGGRGRVAEDERRRRDRVRGGGQEDEGEEEEPEEEEPEEEEEPPEEVP